MKKKQTQEDIENRNNEMIRFGFQYKDRFGHAFFIPKADGGYEVSTACTIPYEDFERDFRSYMMKR